MLDTKKLPPIHLIWIVSRKAPAIPEIKLNITYIPGEKSLQHN